MDAGNFSCKFGYAGDDMPKAVFPGHVGILREEGDGRQPPAPNRYYVGNTTKLFRPRMDVRPLLDYGVVEDWDAMETVWLHGFRELRCDVSDRPVILAEPAFSIPAQRERTAEIMFESFGVPALYMARQPMLGALCVGRASGIVVDLGYTATRVAPVYDGHVIQSEEGGGREGGRFAGYSSSRHQARLGHSTLRARGGGAGSDCNISLVASWSGLGMERRAFTGWLCSPLSLQRACTCQTWARGCSRRRSRTF